MGLVYRAGCIVGECVTDLYWAYRRYGGPFVVVDTAENFRWVNIVLDRVETSLGDVSVRGLLGSYTLL